MNLSIRYEHDGREEYQEFDVPKVENEVWKKIGEQLLEADIPSKMYAVFTDGGTTKQAVLNIGKRGTYVRDGVKMPSMFVTCTNGIYGLEVKPYEEKYLTCINDESNNYKFYHLKPLPNDDFTVVYGRIGSKPGEAFGVKEIQTPYDSYLYWIRYYEKLSKGYVDQSDIYLGEELSSEPVEETEETVDTINAELYNLLLGLANKTINEALVNNVITVAQYEKSKALYEELCEAKEVKEFNRILKQLMAISPRRCRYVEDLLANKTDDFNDIVLREEGLINAMKAVKTPVLTNAFENAEVYEATDEQKEEILKKLSPSLHSKVWKIYRVIDNEKKKRFDDYLEKNHIKTVKQFWHGSRNENWFSITKNGLTKNPNAVITGKMLGYGIYTSPSSAKSFNYTSYHGTYWANGSSNIGIMGLFATAYGNPLDVDNYSNIRHYTESELKALGKDCVYAHKGNCLREDEICFYNDDAVLMNYLIIFK